MVEYAPDLDTTFAAVSDPTRRAILAALKQGEAPVGELAAPFDMSFQAVSKHIGVLAHAGLVERERQGRIQLCRLVAAPLRDANEWTDDYRRFWEKQLASLDAYLRQGGGR